MDKHQEALYKAISEDNTEEASRIIELMRNDILTMVLSKDDHFSKEWEKYFKNMGISFIYED